MSHPKHPALVHFPITFTVLTGALDAIYYASRQPATAGLVATAFKTLNIAIPPSQFPALSYYATILTIITALPTISTGAWELMPVLKRDGLSSKKARVGIYHALINDITVFGAVFNWWTRRDNAAFLPSDLNVFVSTIAAVPATLFAAYLGGSLVYIYGMGIGGGGKVMGKKAQ